MELFQRQFLIFNVMLCTLHILFKIHENVHQSLRIELIQQTN